MPEYKLHVSEEEAGMRLDQFIAAFSKKNRLGLSRTYIQKSICKGQVKSGSSIIIKPHHKIKAEEGYAISIKEEPLTKLKPEDILFEVVYEDSDIAIINKPTGLTVHPGAGNLEHTLVNGLLHRFRNLSSVNPNRPGIVHRLDKDTSGLLVVAKNNNAHLELSRQFAQHSIERKYIAIVKGKVQFDEDVIEIPIGRHPIKRNNMAVGFTEKTKYAKTHYRTLRRTDNFSLLELRPFTGRTHQLRVHLAFLGHPILGDTKYGRNNEFQRLALHAQEIGFRHPGTGKFINFTSELPKELSSFVKNKT